VGGNLAEDFKSRTLVLHRRALSCAWNHGGCDLIGTLRSKSNGSELSITLRSVSLTYEPLCFILINPQSTLVQQKL
jgi:hypothetical protein